MKITKTVVIIFLIIFVVGLLVLIKIGCRSLEFVDQYMLTSELNLLERYSETSVKSGTTVKLGQKEKEKEKIKKQRSNPWVMITGTSSGMGERFAYEFAERKFNLLLIGSVRTNDVIMEINKKYPNVIVDFIEKDFSKSFEPNFFDGIQEKVDKLGNKWSVLINNVGYRTASLDYRNMDIEEMKKTISVGTLVQSKLIQMALQKFSTRKHHTAIVSITAQNSICTDLFAYDNDLTVPHLACYEATNVYGYCHAKSVYAEIKDTFPLVDYLIITPGAVKTKNTKDVLKNTLFSVDVEVYVKNILMLMGNFQGPRCAYWGHSLSPALLNIAPFVSKETIVKKVGNDFANDFMSKSNKFQ